MTNFVSFVILLSSLPLPAFVTVDEMRGESCELTGENKEISKSARIFLSLQIPPFPMTPILASSVRRQQSF